MLERTGRKTSSTTYLGRYAQYATLWRLCVLQLYDCWSYEKALPWITMHTMYIVRKGHTVTNCPRLQPRHRCGQMGHPPSKCFKLNHAPVPRLRSSPRKRRKVQPHHDSGKSRSSEFNGQNIMEVESVSRYKPVTVSLRVNSRGPAIWAWRA